MQLLLAQNIAECWLIQFEMQVITLTDKSQAGFS
ncbi:hypothetical protein SAMN05421881_10644 [Nitrosomonas halophila]|uniref:Uncharacterized protein n=1 Tax=Nitrosomonas halophila TaxID=44576 RepID=A0A1H3MS20_9PROT|nr:hypothetical protein SAMN05421881_10644 [Nitrosomonas halophila]